MLSLKDVQTQHEISNLRLREDIVKKALRSCLPLVKILVGSLKILEDLHEDPSADL